MTSPVPDQPGEFTRDRDGVVAARNGRGLVVYDAAAPDESWLACSAVVEVVR